jgi:exosome complex RNA-binding protein Rrp42 (RNase PH superfamily)
VNLREDGRDCQDFRDYYLETNNLLQANGSSRVIFPDCATQILIGIKAQIEDMGFKDNKEGRIGDIC